LARIDEHGEDTAAFEALQLGRISLFFLILDANPELQTNVTQYASYAAEMGWKEISNEIFTRYSMAGTKSFGEVLPANIPSSLFDFR
jgi:hypothetical protein